MAFLRADEAGVLTVRADVDRLHRLRRQPVGRKKGAALLLKGLQTAFIKMNIKSKKKVGDLEVADKVTIQLMYTDPEIRTRKQIVKTSEKNGLYLALDIADAWLTRALAE